MGKLALCRVDYRLAHGQVAAGWTKYLKAKKIVVVDNEVVKDRMLVKMMSLGVPGTKVVAYTIDDSVKEWQKDKFGPGNIIVIFREIENAYEAYEKGFKYNTLNVGQVPAREDRRHAVATINLNDEEMNLLTKLHDDGVEVYNHQTITDKRYTYDDILKSMK